MTARSTSTSLDAIEHVRALAAGRENDTNRRLREETAALPTGRMQISPDQAQLLALLARSVGARRAIEVGVFTGYSALAVAEALPADGTLLACDVSEEWTSVARRYWAEAGVADRIDLRLAPARETLAARIEAGAAGSFDFAFVDADKEGYPGYYEQCLTLLRPGGIVALDNMLYGGEVVADTPPSPEGRILRDLATAIFADERVDPAFLTVGDGVVVARKRC